MAEINCNTKLQKLSEISGDFKHVVKESDVPSMLSAQATIILNLISKLKKEIEAFESNQEIFITSK